MKHEHKRVPGAEGEPATKTLGISHMSEDAGPLADFTPFGARLPVTKVDLTTRESATGPESPGIT